MKTHLQILPLSFLMLFVFSVAATDCQRECGDTSVPYPFGLGNSSDCYKDYTYKLICDETFNPPRLHLGPGLPIFNISIEEGIAFVNVFLAFSCYDQTGVPNKFNQSVTLGYSPFTFSSTGNKFTAIGCSSIALVSGGQSSQTSRFGSGCLPMCGEGSTIYGLQNLTEKLLYCSGDACCQTPISQGLKSLHITLSDLYNQSEPSTCSYGFLGATNFTLGMTPKNIPYSSVMLDWAIGKMTCEEAKKNGSEYICDKNAKCSDSTNGPGYGYRCLCKDGFQGNPYNKNGCVDIDECAPIYGELYPCKGTCKNNPGNYTCSCSFGYQGDGKEGCTMKTSTKVLIAIGASVFAAAVVLSLLWWYKKKIQEMNHIRNGGLLLGQLSVTSFKESQLEKATNSFDSQLLLGEGGNGWVYRGSADNIEIAVKKSKVVDQNQIEQFLNEADIVSKINHKNVVKLLGVCLDSKVPMLVYEFVPNGTLYQHLHGTKSRILDSWRICLRVAAETARALDYMHSQAYPPIIHRDVKSSNILLDGTYTAKVADFGASKLIRLDHTMAHTQGQGTMGYLDPEYLQTGELTTMSDVYGFGVVLMELLSKQKPITRGTSGEMIGLVKVFTSAVENNRFDQVVKVTDVTEHETEQVHLVANLAIRCVAMPSKKRPTMTEVADVLNGLCKVYNSFPVDESCEEVVGLLDDQDVMTTSVHFELEYSGNV